MRAKKWKLNQFFTYPFLTFHWKSSFHAIKTFGYLVRAFIIAQSVVM